MPHAHQAPVVPGSRTFWPEHCSHCLGCLLHPKVDTCAALTFIALCSHGPGEPWAIGIKWVHGHLPVFCKQCLNLSYWQCLLSGGCHPLIFLPPNLLESQPLREPLVSWCGPYRQGCPPLLSLWPESTLLCVSAQSQMWQRLLDVEGTSCCTAVWPLSSSTISFSPLLLWGYGKRPAPGGCVIGTVVILGYFQMSTWGSSHTVVVLNPDLVFWQCILKFYFMSNWMIFHPFSPSKGCNIC